MIVEGHGVSGAGEAGRREPVVRIRVKGLEEAERCRRILTAAGYAPELVLTHLVVRDAHPDQVNETLVRGGAFARVAAREHIGRLVAYLIDRQGRLADRGMNLKNLTGRVLEEAGLTDRYRLRPEPELVAGALALYEHLMASGAEPPSWERFLELFCLAANPSMGA
jgi:hypothetical protein